MGISIYSTLGSTSIMSRLPKLVVEPTDPYQERRYFYIMTAMFAIMFGLYVFHMVYEDHLLMSIMPDPDLTDAQLSEVWNEPLVEWQKQDVMDKYDACVFDARNFRDIFTHCSNDISALTFQYRLDNWMARQPIQ